MTQGLVRGIPDLRVLLRPLDEDRPTGSFLLYEGTYDRIKEARRADDASLPRGVWERELKAADWALVESLCLDALESRTKDVQIAAWLLEAAIQLRDFEGLRQGIEVMLRLCEAFWSELHPPLDDEGEFRCAPFHWMNEKLAPRLFDLPVARPSDESAGSFTWSDWKRALWIESLRARNPKDAEVEAELKRTVSRDQFDRAVAQTPRDYHRKAVVDLAAALENVRDLEALLDRELRERSPSLVRFRENLAEIHGWLRALVRDAPEPREERQAMHDVQMEEEGALSSSKDAQPARASGADAGRSAGAEEEPTHRGPFRGREDAYRQLERAALYLRTIEPHSPAPYLALRAVAWGEKSLNELIREFVRNGLDLEALSNLLGLEDADMEGVR